MGEQTLTVGIVASEWGRIVLERFERQMEALNVGYSFQLQDSLELQLIGEGMNVSEVQFMFNYYGKFVDMGVSKGIDLSEVKALASDRRLGGNEVGNRRKPKKWYSPVFYSEVEKLKFILAENFAKRAVISITENLNDNALMWNPKAI